MNRFSVVASLMGLLVGAFACADDAENTAVAAAVNAVAQCDHWHGEVGDQTPERNAQIEAGANRDCPHAARLLMKVHKKYPNNQLLYMPLLTMADYRHLTLSEYQLKNLCLAVPDAAICKP